MSRARAPRGLVQPAAPEPDPDLDLCAPEPIHRLGSIQPNGALLVLDPGARRVRFASANLAGMLGIEGANAVGTDAADLLPGVVCRALESVPEQTRRPAPLAVPRGTLGGAEILAHHAADGLVVEFVETSDWRNRPDPAAVVAELRATLSGGEANPFRDAHALAHAARQLTGYERVMVYRFRPDWSGEVIAEERLPTLMPFLGLRFPAGDIPVQARALYLRNKVRVTADADETQSPILPLGDPPDLGLALLRSPSPVHLAYLRNMGVRSSLVASILVEGELWGLIACHHDAPCLPPAPVRAAAEALADAFAPAVLRHRAQEAALAEGQIAAGEARLARLALNPGRFLSELLAGPDSLASICAADGIAWTDGAGVLALGAAPPPAWILACQARFSRSGEVAPGLLAATRLEAMAGQIAPAPAAGMLAAMLPRGPAGVPGGMLALFRREFVHEVHWGGDPAKQIQQVGDGSLGPRTSFALWRESVRGTSTAWREAEQGILRRAAERLAGLLVAIPALGQSVFDDFRQLETGIHPGRVGLDHLLAPTDAIAITDGTDAEASTLFVSDPLLQLMGVGSARLVGRPWREAAGKLGIAHAFGAAGTVQDRGIDAWSPEAGSIALAISREPLLQLDAPGIGRARTFSVIRVQDQTGASRTASAMQAVVAQSDATARAQGAIVRTLSHELRTPLAAIIGLGELIAEADGRVPDEVREYGAEVKASGKHLMEVIDAMMDLARIEAGTLRIDCVPFDLAACVRDAVAMVAPMCVARGVTLERSLPPGAVPARGDARLLRQAILNLLTNAAKFTPPGGSVACALRVGGGGAEIRVSDTGPGIAPEDQARIFEPFAQAGDEARRHHGGLGLGLFIARSFVALHGGRLLLEGEPGCGATFRIVLPQLLG